MNKINILCFGFGQVAKSFVKKLKIEKIPFRLTTTSRQETQSKNFEDINYESFQFNEKKFDNNLIKNLDEADHILISIAPVNGEDIVIKNLNGLLTFQQLAFTEIIKENGLMKQA